MFGCRLLCNTDAGEGAQQAVESVGISLTLFSQETNVANLVSKCIGNPQAGGRESTRLREYAIAISTSAAFGVTLPMPPLG